MSNTCKNCRYVVETGHYYKGTDQQVLVCSLTNVTMKPEGTCEYCNADLSNANMCYNCEYYNGGNDFGLFCGRHYHLVGRFNDTPCDAYKKKEG